MMRKTIACLKHDFWGFFCEDNHYHDHENGKRQHAT
ncbi:MAG: hypothetical protein ACJA2J_001851 [Candidatus Azotimanducaceae bacterium]|jgi:hypothetical protein